MLSETGCTKAYKSSKASLNEKQPQAVNFAKRDTMNKQEFWKIIDHAFINSNGSPEIRNKLLIDKLADYTPEQIVEFEKIFVQFVIEADDFKIIAAEKIIEGSVTDDSYLYFRCWLISQGQKTFEETLKDPEYLAEKIDKSTDTQFESLMYISTEAYMKKTGKTEEDETFPRAITVKSGLSYDFYTPPTKGTEWKTEQLPKLYPKLWAKFN
jgi:hypothetical protein